ncbi:MAG: hypothetical protein K8H74_01255 [Notoacmeibacter sp.]|nr:hypothetical protein [Notoacmeibacter sp.]
MARSRLTIVFAIAAALFGILTLLSGGMALFGSPAARAASGAVVPFVLWFNFLAGFAYIAAAYGLFSGRPWAGPLAVAIALSTLLVFAAFGVAVASDVPYEMRTVGAMAVRSAFWIVIAWHAMAGRRIAQKQEYSN